MPTLYERNPSLWVSNTAEYSAPPLTSNDLRVDVAVIGAGITGLLTAYRLGREGALVAVLDKGRVAASTTGYTTAKITSLHGLVYQDLVAHFGDEKARIYAEANQSAVVAFGDLISEAAIDCDFRWASAYTYTESGGFRTAIEKEVGVCTELGLPATFVETTELPFPIKGAIRVDEQAMFHPRKFCLALADYLIKDGHHVFEMTRVLDVEEESPCVVHTDQGILRAESVVIATQTPFLGRGDFHSKTRPSRSYIVAFDVEDPIKGMYLNVESPTRSLRPHVEDGHSFLLVGGEGHAVGAHPDTRRRYAALESWAGQRFPGAQVQYRWSAQDYLPADHVPFIGPLDTSAHHIYVVTGFRKWGMTHGMVAANIITDLIAGRRNDWLSLYDSRRSVPAEPLAGSSAAGAEQERQLGEQDAAGSSVRSPEEVAPGNAAVLDLDGKKVAVYVDEAGDTHKLSAICTHLGCEVRWNTAESTWDCPCHGSRFTYDGSLIQGPAVDDLSPA